MCTSEHLFQTEGKWIIYIPENPSRLLMSCPKSVITLHLKVYYICILTVLFSFII